MFLGLYGKLVLKNSHLTVFNVPWIHMSYLDLRLSIESWEPLATLTFKIWHVPWSTNFNLKNIYITASCSPKLGQNKWKMQVVWPACFHLISYQLQNFPSLILFLLVNFHLPFSCCSWNFLSEIACGISFSHIVLIHNLHLLFHAPYLTEHHRVKERTSI